MLPNDQYIYILRWVGDVVSMVGWNHIGISVADAGAPLAPVARALASRHGTHLASHARTSTAARRFQPHAAPRSTDVLSSCVRRPRQPRTSPVAVLSSCVAPHLAAMARSCALGRPPRDCGRRCKGAGGVAEQTTLHRLRRAARSSILTTSPART
jgi:hypothetical protein